MESNCSRNSEENLAMIDGSDKERRFLEEKGEIVRGYFCRRERLLIAPMGRRERWYAFSFWSEEGKHEKRLWMWERRNATEFLERERQHALEIQESRHIFKLSFEDEKSALITSWDREKQTLLQWQWHQREEGIKSAIWATFKGERGRI